MSRQHAVALSPVRGRTRALLVVLGAIPAPLLAVELSYAAQLAPVVCFGHVWADWMKFFESTALESGQLCGDAGRGLLVLAVPPSVVLVYMPYPHRLSVSWPAGSSAVGCAANSSWLPASSTNPIRHRLTCGGGLWLPVACTSWFSMKLCSPSILLVVLQGWQDAWSLSDGWYGLRGGGPASCCNDNLMGTDQWCRLMSVVASPFCYWDRHCSCQQQITQPFCCSVRLL